MALMGPATGAFRAIGARFAPLQANRSTFIRFRLKARVTSVHSPVTAARPRSENWRKPMTCLMIPNTGSTVDLRLA